MQLLHVLKIRRDFNVVIFLISDSLHVMYGKFIGAS